MTRFDSRSRGRGLGAKHQGRVQDAAASSQKHGLARSSEHSVKDHYFGDVNKSGKYGLLRCLVEAAGLHLGVAWFLTIVTAGS